MSILKFHTPAGQCDIIYLKDFPDRITITRVQGNTVHYPSYDDEANKIARKYDELWTPVNAVVKSNIATLNMKISIDRVEGLYDRYGKILYNKRKAAINEDMKIMIGQTTPTLFVKDLTLDVVQNLSTHYAKTCYGGDVIGLHVDLGPYSKFFCIFDDKEFKWYETEPYKEINRDATTFLGKLVNLYPNRFFMARYENLVYLKEMNSRMLYIPPGEGPNE